MIKMLFSWMLRYKLIKDKLLNIFFMRKIKNLYLYFTMDQRSWQIEFVPLCFKKLLLAHENWNILFIFFFVRSEYVHIEILDKKTYRVSKKTGLSMFWTKFSNFVWILGIKNTFVKINSKIFFEGWKNPNKYNLTSSKVVIWKHLLQISTLMFCGFFVISHSIFNEWKTFKNNRFEIIKNCNL